MKNKLSIALVLCALFLTAGCKNKLQNKIEQIAQTKQAQTGVAVIGFNKGKREIIEVNGELHYPMQSVYKFHVALAIMDMVDKGMLRLNQEIMIFRFMMKENTHSPLRDRYPEQEIFITLEELLRYSVSESDNNACDVLFEIAGGPEAVNKYIKGLGITNTNIAATEAEMHEDMKKINENWSTPLACAQLLEKFYTGHILSYESRDFLMDLMRVSPSMGRRIQAMLPQYALVTHKTGTGPETDDIITACNDIAIVSAPDQRYFMIAVFIADSKETMEENEKTIAEIAKAAWDHFIKEKK